MLEAAEQLRDTATAAPAARGRVVAAAEVGHASKLTDSEMRGEIAGLRAGLALRHADFPRAILLGQEALEQINQVSPRRGLIVWTLGRAYGANGDVQAASQVQAELRRSSFAQGHTYLAFLA